MYRQTVGARLRESLRHFQVVRDTNVSGETCSFLGNGRVSLGRDDIHAVDNPPSSRPICLDYIIASL